VSSQPASNPSIHASAVLVGDCAVLIRGPSGAGKSRLALALIEAGRTGRLPKTSLIGDDRVRLESGDGAVTIRGMPELAELIEVRGLGIRRVPFVTHGRIGLVVDLSASDAERLPPASALVTSVEGIKIPRIPVAPDYDPLPLVVAWFTTDPEK
jgi:serine kinase of HPr protein (carbohydrate metabolism regulator)